ncbi:hypothetical protein MFIFM68171_08394 [Madurella fahalii]|uniref:Uncharacterized protein n=1 Tax=Madurella fahalii TaxID=1157608 RepID=A0ABQ0GKB2_9PEZI
MRLPTIALTAAMLQAASLASLDPSSPLWHTDFASYPFNFKDDGCQKNIGVPFIEQVCIDIWRDRAHFIVTGGQKRCMKLFRSNPDRTGGFQCAKPDSGRNSCQFQRWEEVGCDW